MKKLLIYIAAFAMILAMNTSCEDMGTLEEKQKKMKDEKKRTLYLKVRVSPE